MLPSNTEASCAAGVPFTWNSEGSGGTMADRAAEIRYLREKARQFRELASTYDTEISPRLFDIARELEERADELERRSGN
jgi:hypothetical protein